ncbi:DNA-dependent RNA polymerase [Aeromonas phage JELG-KS1]|uniref:DNA-directed RNA polymerase n=1 Tax=Aeromonas phage JELG-KS1 TaxID=2951233 RepID=A0A9E7NN60_9CAUD|nr:DNA-dependent RNA polymerase [Aeromonas phage JELG-KS1]
MSNTLTNRIAANDFNDIKFAVKPFNLLADAYGETLAAEQLALEHESYELGEKRFMKTLERQIERGELTDNAVAKPLLETLVNPLAARLTEWLDAPSGRGRPHVAKAYLQQLTQREQGAHQAAYMTVKTVLFLLARDQTRTVQHMAFAIAGHIQDEVRYGRIRVEEAEHFKKNVEGALAKRQGIQYKRAYMQAVEAGMIEKGELTSTHEEWPRDHMFHIGVRMLEMLIESTGLVELKLVQATANRKDDYTAVELTEAYVEKLANRAHALAGISPLYQPTIVPPKPWTSVRGGGYWAKGRRPLNLIRVGSKRALERYADIEMPAVFAAVNTIQNTAWKVNEQVLAVANMVTGWENCPVGDIPSKNPVVKPKLEEGICKADGTLIEAVELDDAGNPVCPDQLKRWKRNAASIYRREKARQSRRLSLEFILGQANKFAKYESIWFPHNLDWRGRVYSVPMFNPQGNDMTKGLLTFAQTKPLGAEGAYWLAVHGANTAGIDKVSLDDRVKWVKENEFAILASARAPLDNTWWAEQDSPFCFLAFCFDWLGYVESGRSENYESSLPLAFDGTCSGLQHFSAMLRDEVGGAAVNLTPSEKPQDVYGIVAVEVNKVLTKLAAEGSDDEMVAKEDKTTGEILEVLKLGTKTLARQWLEFGVSRSVTKRSVMTLAYGSKKFGFAEQVREDTVQPALDSGKGQMFTIPSQACQFMAELIWDAVSVTVVAAVQAMDWLQKAATLISSEVKDKKSKEVIKPALPVHWTTPVGFPVWSEYRVQDQKRIDCTIMGGLRFTATINVKDGIKIDAKKQASGIAPNFVHSMDASHLKLTVLKCMAYGVTSFAMIHDSFGCHAGNAHLMFKAVRETMVDTYEQHDVIAEFYEEFHDQLHADQLDKMPALPSKGNLDLKLILESRYTFS